jgi:hypothetical protein
VAIRAPTTAVRHRGGVNVCSIARPQQLGRGIRGGTGALLQSHGQAGDKVANVAKINCTAQHRTRYKDCWVGAELP